MRRRDLFRAMLAPAGAPEIMTVTGPARSPGGIFLVHEHLFSIFGEEPAENAAYDQPKLLQAVVPYVARLKELGVGAIADGTAALFGRAPDILRTISQKTGVHILTNTGLYGAAEDRYVPDSARRQTADELAARWAQEFRQGIGPARIKPGFLKIGVDPGRLSEIDRKLIIAAALTARTTGLVIQVHTGDNPQGAHEQLDILASHKVRSSAWIWIHADKCKDLAALDEAARRGAWLSFDGVAPDNFELHLQRLRRMRELKRLHQVLLSHDGNSFRPAGRPMKPYDSLMTGLIPLLRSSSFDEPEIRQLTAENPMRAFTLQPRAA